MSMRLELRRDGLRVPVTSQVRSDNETIVAAASRCAAATIEITASRRRNRLDSLLPSGVILDD